jgi:hypothetical protein
MNKLNTYIKSNTFTVMVVYVMVFQVQTLCSLPRGLQRNGQAVMKTEVRYYSATLLATYQTTKNIAMRTSVSGMFSASHRNSRVALRWR